MIGDIGLFPITDNSNRVDLQLANGDFVLDAGIRTAIQISLFSDRRCELEELPAEDSSRRGWWGDVFPDVDGDLIGSKLWLLKREKQTVETLNKAVDYSREALQWLVEDGVASSFDVSANFDTSGFLVITILIYEPTGKKTFQFSAPWGVEGTRGSS